MDVIIANESAFLNTASPQIINFLRMNSSNARHLTSFFLPTSSTTGRLRARSRLFILLIPMLLYSAASLIVSVSFCEMGTKSAQMIFDRGNQAFEGGMRSRCCASRRAIAPFHPRGPREHGGRMHDPQKNAPCPPTVEAGTGCSCFCLFYIARVQRKLLAQFTRELCQMFSTTS